MPEEREHAAARLPDEAAASAIRAPLSLAMDKIAALLQGSLAAETREPLQTAHNALRGLPAMIQALARQSLSHSQAAVEVQFSLRDRLSQLFHDCLAAARRQGALLRLDIDSDVPDILLGDAERLAQVLITAILHAIPSAADGEMVLKVEAEFLTQSQASLAFLLRQPAGTPSLVAMELVRSMDGRILDGREAKGGFAFSSRFGLGQTVAGPIAAPRVARLAGMRVLVAFGSATERAEISRLVRQWHLQTIEADGGDMAVALLDHACAEGRAIPLALIGNRLQGEDGFLLALRIKRNARLLSTHIIMLTGEGRPGDALRCRENGVAGYLPLPTNPADLLAALTTITGASAEGDDTPTLVTRHSLRESRRGGAVLIVTADREEQLLLSHFLADTSFAITLTASAEQAIQAAQSQRFEVVVLDTQLPDMDGLALAQALREIDRLAGGGNALILALSADLAAQPLAAGIDALLARPVSKAALLEAVTNL